VRNAAIAQTS